MTRPRKQMRAFDWLIAGNIRKARKEAKITQKAFAPMIGVSVNQLAKYEQTVDRMSCGRLALIAQVLNKPVTYFFQGDICRNNVVS